MILRYFNVAGADPKMRTGQSTPLATHLIKVAVQTAVGLRPKMQVFGTDYPTPDGTCIRDYIHVSDLVAAHTDALSYLRKGGDSATINCGYGRGFSVLDVIETVKRVAGVEFQGRARAAPRRRSGADRGRGRQGAKIAQLAAALRRPCDHRLPRPGMGEKAQGSQGLRPDRAAIWA